MMSQAYIEEMNREQAAKAAREKKKPFLVTEQDIETFKHRLTYGGLKFPFPYIGDYRPKGWRLKQTFFTDSSGLGAEDEPAITIRKLVEEKLKAGYGYAIVSAGQFQVVIGEFEKL